MQQNIEKCFEIMNAKPQPLVFLMQMPKQIRDFSGLVANAWDNRPETHNHLMQMYNQTREISAHDANARINRPETT